MRTLREDIRQVGRSLVILAGERTLLSWVRVSLAMMGLGFALDRLGVYLRLKDAGHSPWMPKLFTFAMGIGLVIAGALMAAAAGVMFTRFRIRLAREGKVQTASSGALGMLLAVGTTLVGTVTAIFLILISD